MVTRVRITHEHDRFKGQIGYVLETIDQHSLYTYVVTFKGQDPEFKRAYQRDAIKIIHPVRCLPWNPEIKQTKYA